MKRFVFSFLFVTLALASSSWAGQRYPVNSNLVVTDLGNGRRLTFEANRGFTYELIEAEGRDAKVRFFDREGAEVVGDFWVSRELVQEALKQDIAAGLRAASRGSTNPKPGCCDLAPEPREARRDANRAPAIAPGARIVYADPPRPPAAPAPLPPRRPRELALAPSQAKDGDGPRSPASHPDLCRSLQEFREKGVPEAPLRQALFFLAQARADGRVSDSRYLAIGDFSQRSSERRFYVLDLRDNSVTQEKVSHGGGVMGSRGAALGDPDHDGMLNACGQGEGMHRTGFFRVGDYYFSQRGRYRWPLVTRDPPRNGVQLHGLSPSVNDQSLGDGVVMHEAKYNANDSSIMGRSHGCPAFAPGRGAPVMARLARGSLYYSYAPMCRNDTVRVLSQVQGWQSFCR